MDDNVSFLHIAADHPCAALQAALICDDDIPVPQRMDLNALLEQVGSEHVTVNDGDNVLVAKVSGYPVFTVHRKDATEHLQLGIHPVITETPDRMQAILYLWLPPTGSTLPEPSTMLEVLDEEGICYGRLQHAFASSLNACLQKLFARLNLSFSPEQKPADRGLSPALSCSIMIKGKVFAGTEIRCGNSRMTLPMSVSNVTFRLQEPTDDRAHFGPYSLFPTRN